MRRLLLAIAVLFAFASASGPLVVNTAYAQSHPGVAMAQALGDDICVASADATKVPVFKPCGKKINGKVVFCQQPMVLPSAQLEIPLLTSEPAATAPRQLARIDMVEPRFRPPRFRA